MPTFLGAIFFIAGVYCFLCSEDALLGLLIWASIFQASSAVKFGERGIQPFYIVETFIIARALLNRLNGKWMRQSLPHGRWLLSFAVVAVITTFTAPFIFSGVPVYDPIIGIDQGLFLRPPLHFGLNNVTQAVFVIWHVATAYSVLALKFSISETRRAYVIAFYFVVFCVFAQSICQVTGISFPDFLVRNNPNIWDLGTDPGVLRKPGTFLEPSFAGAFFVLHAISFIAEYLAGKGSAIRVALALMASGLVTSSGSLFVLFAGTAGLAFHYSPLRLPWYINFRKVKRLAWIALIMTAPLLLAMVASATYRNSLLDLTLAKGSTGSFFNRTASDVYALQLLVQTYGIGVGMGSNRASSIITSLASNVGILGVVLFSVFCVRLFVGLSKANSWLKWSSFALLVNMCFDIPDATFPVLWVAILLALSLYVQASANVHKSSVRDLVPVHA